MKTKLLSAFVLLFMCIAANAYDVEVDGVYYNVDLTTLEASVTKGGDVYQQTYYSGDVVVPDSFTYGGRVFKVTAVDYCAFEWNKELNSVTLPNTIKFIGDQAFIRCENLMNVKLPDSITAIPTQCFAFCKTLNHIDIPNSVTYYGNGAFEECYSLGPSFIVGRNVQLLDGSPWSSCTSMEKIIFEDTTATLECGNRWLNPLNFSGVDSIYVGRPIDFSLSYLGMEKMNYIELGQNLKTGDVIGISDNLKTLVSDIMDPTQFVPDFTNNVYLHTTLYVPVGKVDAYRQAEGWKNFFDIRENHGEVNKIDNVAAAKKAGATMYYNLSGQAVAKDYKGVVIERYSDGTSKKVLNK